MRADARRACFTVAVLGVFSMLGARPASAGTISVDSFFQGVGVGFHLEDGFGPGADYHAFAQIGSVTMSNATDVAGIDFTTAFEAYCVDILGPIFDPNSSTENLPARVTAVGGLMTSWSDPGGLPSPAGAGAAAAGLYNMFNPTIQGLAGNAAVTIGAITTTADVARTALAMSIWNELYDGDGNVASGGGNFYVWCDSTNPAFNTITGCTSATETGTIVTLANAFMAAAGAGDATWIKLGDPAIPDGDIQDFIGPGAAQPVPEPSSLALLGIGAAAAFGRARARRRGVAAGR